MGLPGAGKTTFTKQLVAACSFHIDAYNGDTIRKYYDDWHFNEEGRLRQARRMRLMADLCIEKLGYHCVCDFVCPTQALRDLFDPDIMVWMNTIQVSRYEDTNMCFEKPNNYTYMITSYDQYDDVVKEILKQL